MIIKIKDKEIELCYTMRMFIIYENITGENIDFNNMQSLKQVTTLLLACIIASAQKAKKELNLDYSEFMDWLDENGDYSLINDFAIWLAKEIETKVSLLKKEEEQEDDFPKTRKKAKN